MLRKDRDAKAFFICEAESQKPIRISAVGLVMPWRFRLLATSENYFDYSDRASMDIIKIGNSCELSRLIDSGQSIKIPSPRVGN